MNESVAGRSCIMKVRRQRDILRKTTVNARYVIMGVENQSNVHYAMPLRIMLYDALGYTDECKISGALQDASKWTVDEYLSKMTKNTKRSGLSYESD